MKLFSIDPHISCINIPYKDIFVGIYLIITEKGAVLFDAAATDADVEEYILPMVRQLGVIPTHIFVSHDHKDHSGGLAKAAALFPEATILSRSQRLAELYPNLCYPEDGDMLLDVLQVVTIPGHTSNSMALLDQRTGTLITGDCLQSYGIYGSGAWYGVAPLVEDHLAALKKLRALPIEAIATAHDYHPDGQISVGHAAAQARIDNCIGAFNRIANSIRTYPQLNVEKIAELCNDGMYPTVSVHMVECLRQAQEKGLL